MIIDELVAILGYDLKGEDNLKRFNSSIDSAAKGLTRFAGIAAAAAAAAGAALTAGMGILGKSVINVNAEFESLEATLTTIEGSTDKARKSLEWVSDFAQTTPYDLKQVGEAFVRLKAYGLDPTTGLLEDLGNASSAMGKDLMAAVEMIADASTGEFERLKEFGLRASQAGDEVTFSWTENGKSLTKTVKKNGAEITAFIQQQFGHRFSGAMMRQSKTWNGMLSNLGDTWTRFLYQIGQAGFFDVAKNKLADLMDALGRFTNSGAAKKFSDALSKMFIFGADLIGVAVSRIVRHVSFIAENMDRLKPYLQGVGIAMGVLAAWAFPLVTAFAFVGLAIEDFLSWLEGGESIIGQFIEWIKKLPEAFGKIDWQNAGREAAKLLISGLQSISEMITNINWGGVGFDIAGSIFEGFKILKDFIIGFMSEIGPYVVQSFKNILTGIKAEILGVLPSALTDGMPNAPLPTNDNIRLQDAQAARQSGVGPSPGKVADDLNIGLGNARDNIAKMGASNAAQSIENTVNDSRNQSVTVQVGGVTVQGVQNVTPAVGAAVGQAVGNASAGAATPPARLVGGGL